MRRLGSIAVLVAACWLVTASAPAQPQLKADPPQKIEIASRPIDAFDPRDPQRTRFGALTFRGGLVLTSPHRDFGGLSALRVQADGQGFIALSDRGRWLRGRIVYRGDAPAAIADAEMAPVLGPDGQPLRRRGWYDTESLAQSGGILHAGIERVHQIVRFDYGRHGLLARGQPIALPPAIRKWPNNMSLECLAAAPAGRHAGALVAISERALDGSGNIQGFVIGGARPAAFAVRRTDDFDISDCAFTPRGGLLILERRFSWTRGLAIRIRHLPFGDVQSGAPLDGPEIVFMDLAQQVDNMEGLSVHRAADGQIVLTLISDDNFSPIQRTLLLQFAWSE